MERPHMNFDHRAAWFVETHQPNVKLQEGGRSSSLASKTDIYVIDI